MKKLILIAALALSGCAAQKLFDPANLTIEADTSWQSSGDVSYYDRYWNRYDGALGRAAIIMDAKLTDEINLKYGLEHRSYLSADDRGEERAIVGLTWRPFR